MAENQAFTATVREQVGKGHAKTVRSEGKVPGVMYGPGIEPQTLTLNMADAKAIVDHPAIINLTIDGKEQAVLLKEVQRHFLSHEIQHVDLLAVNAAIKIQTEVPVTPHGEAEGTHHGGILEQTNHTIEVECLPKDLPEEIECDVTHLDVGDRILARDIIMPAGVTSLADATTVIFAIHLPRATVAATDAETVEAGDVPETATPDAE